MNLSSNTDVVIGKSSFENLNMNSTIASSLPGTITLGDW